MASWEIGDTVQLKSGGDAMTVNKIGGDFVGCVWFLNGKPETFLFHPDALMPHKTTDARPRT